jgi:hypothetical protein
MQDYDKCKVIFRTSRIAEHIKIAVVVVVVVVIVVMLCQAEKPFQEEVPGLELKASCIIIH